MADKNSANGTGFAGLGSMVSDIDKDLGDLAKIEPHPPPSAKPERASVEQRADTSTIATQQPVIPNTGGEVGSTNNDGRLWIFVAPIGLVLVVLMIFFSMAGRQESPRSRPSVSASPEPRASYTPPAPAYIAPPAKNYSPPPAPERVSSETNSKVEERPPAGKGQRYEAAQIRYCLSEKIRMEGMKGLVNSYSETSVSSFNHYVEDYNARCSEFHYRSGLLEIVRSGVEARRRTLRSEGVSRALKNP